MRLSIRQKNLDQFFLSAHNLPRNYGPFVQHSDKWHNTLNGIFLACLLFTETR